MISRILTLSVLALSIFLTGCTTTGTNNNTNWGKCAAIGGAIWGAPGAVHSIATGGATLVAGAIISGAICAASNNRVTTEFLPSYGTNGSTVARFKLNSATLDNISKRTIDNFLQGHMNSLFSVIGHTCDLGSHQVNHKLSEQRAISVKNHLIHKGISANKIQIEAKADEHPLYKNNSEEHRRMNRRVEISIIK